MTKGPEQRLYTPIQDALRSRGAFCLKIHGDGFQPKAIDFVGIYRGIGFGIEVKTLDNPNPTDIQQDTIDKIKRAGGVTRVVYTVKGALRVLDEIDRRLDRA